MLMQSIKDKVINALLRQVEKQLLKPLPTIAVQQFSEAKHYISLAKSHPQEACTFLKEARKQVEKAASHTPSTITTKCQRGDLIFEINKLEKEFACEDTPSPREC